MIQSVMHGLCEMPLRGEKIRNGTVLRNAHCHRCTVLATVMKYGAPSRGMAGQVRSEGGIFEHKTWTCLMLHSCFMQHLYMYIFLLNTFGTKSCRCRTQISPQHILVPIDHSLVWQTVSWSEPRLLSWSCC